MQFFHDADRQETIIEFYFSFFDLPIHLQRLLVSRYLTTQTRVRFAQTSKQAKILCYELSYDYPFNTTSTQLFLTKQFVALGKNTKALEGAKKALVNYKEPIRVSYIIGMIGTLICIVICLALSLSLALTIFKKNDYGLYMILFSVFAPVILGFAATLSYHSFKKCELTHKQHHVRKLDMETHLIKLGLINEFAKEPRLKKYGERVLGTMNFRG